MADHDYDINEINNAFADFRTGVLPVVQPAGFQQARATARRRRTARTVALVGAVVIAVAAPIATGAALANRTHPTPADTGSPTSVASASVPASATAAPSQSPSWTPPSIGPATTAGALVCPSGRPGATSGSGGLIVTDLCNATLDIPQWPDAARHPGQSNNCMSGRVTFTAGAHYVAASEYVSLGVGWTGPPGAAAVDLDRDGADEVVALVSCGGQGWDSQVLAFKRAPDGSIQTLDPILAGGAVPGIERIATTAAGVVRVDVADYPGIIGGWPAFAQHQSRFYAWNGSGFAQIQGPADFPANPKITDLATTATDLAFAAPVNGQRSGTQTVTVRNAGGSSIPFKVIVPVPGFADLVPQTGCTEEPAGASIRRVTCTASGLSPGATLTLALKFKAPDQVTVDYYNPTAQTSPAAGYGDPVFDNDLARFAVTVN